MLSCYVCRKTEEVQICRYMLHHTRKNTKQQTFGHVVSGRVSSNTVLHPRGFVPTTDINTHIYLTWRLQSSTLFGLGVSAAPYLFVLEMIKHASAIIRNHPQSVRSANVGAAPAHDSHSYGRSKSSRWGAVFICSMFVKFGSWNGRYGRLWQMLQRNWMKLDGDEWRWMKMGGYGSLCERSRRKSQGPWGSSDMTRTCRTWGQVDGVQWCEWEGRSVASCKLGVLYTFERVASISSSPKTTEPKISKLKYIIYIILYNYIYIHKQHLHGMSYWVAARVCSTSARILGCGDS